MSSSSTKMCFDFQYLSHLDEIRVFNLFLISGIFIPVEERCVHTFLFCLFDSLKTHVKSKTRLSTSRIYKSGDKE